MALGIRTVRRRFICKLRQRLSGGGFSLQRHRFLAFIPNLYNKTFYSRQEEKYGHVANLDRHVQGQRATKSTAAVAAGPRSYQYYILVTGR